MEKHFELDLPEEVLAGFGWNDVDVPAKVRQALVMDLLRLDRLSEAQAAGLLQLTRSDLLSVMGQHRVPAIQLTAAEVQQELSQDIPRSNP